MLMKKLFIFSEVAVLIFFFSLRIYLRYYFSFFILCFEPSNDLDLECLLYELKYKINLIRQKSIMSYTGWICEKKTFSKQNWNLLLSLALKTRGVQKERFKNVGIKIKIKYKIIFKSFKKFDIRYILRATFSHFSL